MARGLLTAGVAGVRAQYEIHSNLPRQGTGPEITIQTKLVNLGVTSTVGSVVCNLNFGRGRVNNGS